MISTVILTKNVSNAIKACLESVSWCDEIIIIDDNSTDETRDIAKKLGAKVYENDLAGNFSQQRNFGLEKATGEWVLFVDSDEIIPENLAKEIQAKLLENKANGFFIKRDDFIFGKKILHGEMGDTWLVRLAKKNVGKWEGRVHEVWKIKGKTEQLKNSLLHYPHQTISEFMQEINFYSTLRAQELFNQHMKVNWWDIILYPKAKFFINYFIKLGILDGVPGFIVAVIMSFHSFLVRGKLWQLQNKTS